MLDLCICGIANSHRTHAAIAAEVFGHAFIKLGNAHNRIERLDLASCRLSDDIAQIGEIFLQHIERAQSVEGLDGVIAVANPAVTIVPIALASWRFGDGGCKSRYNRARFLMLAQFQRNRAADHIVLPFQRSGKAAHPKLPILTR